MFMHVLNVVSMLYHLLKVLSSGKAKLMAHSIEQFACLGRLEFLASENKDVNIFTARQYKRKMQLCIFSAKVFYLWTFCH